MVSPCYDPLGLVIHPLSALLNHSCDYNAFIRFDHTPKGHQMSVCALRPIACGEEIVVSYIDATYPYHLRQQELQDRYFFACKCIKCSSDSTKHDGSLDLQYPEGRRPLERKAFDLLAYARKDLSPTGSVWKLEYAIHMLRSQNPFWAPHHQPLPSLRQQLVVSLITAAQYHLAFIHAFIQYHFIDHKIMPERHHPIRLVHQWLVIALIEHIELSRINSAKLVSQRYDVLVDRSI